MIRVIVVDDQKLMRDGLKTILSLEDNIEVVGTAADGAQALAVAQETKPDLVLMDIRMPGVDGVQGTRLIREQLPETKVLMLTTFNDSELILDALEEGASGYLLKDMPTEVIVQAIMTVDAGGIVLPPESTAQVVAEWKRGREHAAPEGREQAVSVAPPYLDELTEREHDVLQLLGQGMNNKEIGETLVITEGTVKNHVSNIIAKLRLRDRTQAAIYAVRHGIASFPS
ncbi:LuxR family two component transcriptional regulator [Tumebacillus sp. BK434]|uniref:response regulator n=1 Tax=Tumebacillus sp. BK434 TaxID=2512169 RepID=UPI001053CEEB|nr:response regulator transcription factor [Tumebacillus sp. BK434]TCP58061.1 LuxR family two component transcriptional regulator [Tumebacillus sp. BK434]